VIWHDVRDILERWLVRFLAEIDLTTMRMRVAAKTGRDPYWEIERDIYLEAELEAHRRAGCLPGKPVHDAVDLRTHMGTYIES